MINAKPNQINERYNTTLACDRNPRLASDGRLRQMS